MNSSIRISLVTLVSALLLLIALQVQAAPTITGPVITEAGRDVNVTLRIQDLARNASTGLPLAITVFLCEDDIFFDDLLGAVSVTIPAISPTGSTLTGLNGYLSPSLTLTFTDASNAATGFGDDYFVSLNRSDCDN